MKNEYAQLKTMKRKHGASKKRTKINSKLSTLVQDMIDKFTSLESNLKELKKIGK